MGGSDRVNAAVAKLRGELGDAGVTTCKRCGQADIGKGECLVCRDEAAPAAEEARRLVSRYALADKATRLGMLTEAVDRATHRHRDCRALTRARMAAAMDVNDSTLYRWSKGQSAPPGGHLAYMVALGLSLMESPPPEATLSVSNPTMLARLALDALR